MANRKISIGIVGGGLLGMTLALRLAEKGFRITLIEGDSRTGGLAAPMKIGDYTWDRFYHVILMSDTNFLELLALLNLSEKIEWGETKTGFFVQGNLYSMSSSFEFLTFPPLNLIDKFRLGWTIFYASKIKDWKRLEKIPVSDWLKRLSGEHTFNKIWLPLLKSKLGEDYKLASASFIWAIIARMYAARRSGLKKEMFGYVEGGYSTILTNFKGLLNSKGIETVCNSPVKKILDNSNMVSVETASGKNYNFDEVVLTTPCSQFQDLSHDFSQSELERFNNITYQGIICASLILKKSLSDYYVTNITDEWVPFTAVIEMTSLVDKECFKGNALVYLPRYLTHEDEYWKKTDEQIKEDFLSALESMYSSFERRDVLSFDLTVASHVLPVTTMNYSTQLLPPMRTSLNHVYVVNSAQIANGTMNINEIIGHANRKAEEIKSIISV